MQLKKKDMQSYRQKTEPLYPVPKRVQELIPVYRIAKDGVFQIERTGEDGQALFDKAICFLIRILRQWMTGKKESF